MDLSKPNQDITKEYDTKLYDIQKNIEELEKQFGFKREQVYIPNQIDNISKKKVSFNHAQTSREKAINEDNGEEEEEEQPQLMRPTPIPMNSTKYLNITKKQTRYTNLVQIKAEQPKQVKKNPEISEKWPEVFAEKPNLMIFYDKDEFNPVDFDKKDFQTNIHLKKDNDVFNEYMDTFCLSNI